MRVFGTGVSTDPKRSGLFFRGGDVCSPRNGKMLGPVWPTRITRFYCPLPVIPFLSLRLDLLATLAALVWVTFSQSPAAIATFLAALGLLAWRPLRRFGFYVGGKVYGADSDAYKNWMRVKDVYPGSLAMVLTARFFTDG